MAEVAVILRVMPESVEVDLSKLEAAIREKPGIHSVVREPIAFGLEALKVLAVVEDAAGGTEPIEKELASIPGVGGVEVMGLTRLL
ncbi:MAG: elongation factor 1-beta [Candidatus Hadarchaeales archaeon]